MRPHVQRQGLDALGFELGQRAWNGPRPSPIFAGAAQQVGDHLADIAAADHQNVMHRDVSDCVGT
jgi:hypothetical protein